MRIGLLITALMLLVSLACSSGDEPTLRPQPEAPAIAPTPIPTTAPVAVASPTPRPSPVPIQEPTDARLVVEDVEGGVGDVVTVNVFAEDMEYGISGYALRLSLADPEIGQITQANLPDFGLTMITELPAPIVDITAADLPELIEGSFEQELIASLDVELLKAGQTEIALDLRILDDDDGRSIIPDVANGSLIVN